jgi:hypothetical protein
MAGKTLTPFCLHVQTFRMKLALTRPPSSAKKTVFKLYRSGNRTGNPDAHSSQCCGTSADTGVRRTFLGALKPFVIL